MIIYKSTKVGFINEVISGQPAQIEETIYSAYKTKTGKSVGNSEIASWKNSLFFMMQLLNDKDIPDDSGISIEYHIPSGNQRIDFIITGEDESNKEHAVLIELKQWSKAQLTDKDGLVETQFSKGSATVSHPSYQVWSYATLLENFNETVYEEGIQLRPCAYLHNYVPDNVITNTFYADYIEKAPVFLKGDSERDKLRSFIKRFIKHGDKKELMFRIDSGKIKPAKSLADSLSSMLKGNAEFVMIDDQKVVYETALALAKKSSEKNKYVLIVEGGPGTGKSVVAINLLVSLSKLGLFTQYVTKNAAPRAVYESMLTGSMRKSKISSLFSGSGSYTEAPANAFDVLVIDEAHRLNAKSGMLKNLGENQIKEIVNSSKCSIFFLDEDQKVTFHDIGEEEEIIRWAKEGNASVQTLALTSQFRCGGSNGYIAWLDGVLGIRETANTTLQGIEYDFKIIDSPNKLRDKIIEKNKINNKARLVAGYCWNWVSKKSSNLNDIEIPEHHFSMKWNLASDGNLWILSPESVNEVGCIHTCQGLEVDYIGVIVGDDFVVRNGQVITDPSKRARTDKSLSGYKKLLKINPDEANHKADIIIKNTYRTLMTRGMKGCYVYFTDKKTEEYFKQRTS